MSSPPPPTATTTLTTTTISTATDTYWCHECDMSILLSTPHPLSTPPPRCPHCQNCILEHMDTFPPITNIYDPSLWAPPGDNNFLLTRPYLHRLIHHLENHDRVNISPGGTGSARASRNAIASLKMINVSNDVVENENNCPICKEQFSVDDMANELPCGHIFHNECIVPWLEINSSCPLCRFSLVTEDEDEDEDELSEEAYIGAMRLDELLDEGDDDGGDYENELRQLMRIERGGSGGGRMMLSPTQIGEAGNGGVVDRANSVETVSTWPVWETEGEREVGTSDVENVVRG